METFRQGELAAVLDACVLAPMPLCDLLLRCAETPALYCPIWSRQILHEVARTLEKFGYTNRQAERRISVMQEAFPECCVLVPRHLLDAFSAFPDPDDRHVAAAAVAAHARFLVTFNCRHFPQQLLDAYGVIVQTPERFLCQLFHLNPGRIIEIVHSQALAIGQDASSILMRLKPQLPEFVKLLTHRTE